jgi:hypothetical protein
MPAKKPTLSKSDFIRKQSLSLSAAQVVAKGKAVGIKFSNQLVYNVRGGSKAMKGTVKKTSTAKPVAATSKAAPAKVSKADFVRARKHLSPKEIVEDAKAAGIKFDVSYVYRVRGYDKTAGKKRATKATAPTSKSSAPTVKPTTRRATPRKAAPVPRPTTTTSSAETLLTAVAAEIGLGRAIELLQGERARVHSILRG